MSCSLVLGHAVGPLPVLIDYWGGQAHAELFVTGCVSKK